MSIEQPTRVQNSDNYHIEACLKGERLYGDNLSPGEVRIWLEDEERGYFDLQSRNREKYVYGYHALNQYHGYRRLPNRNFSRVLGLGSAYGDELKPIAFRASKLTILEPADGFVVNDVSGVPVTYVKPRAIGEIPFPDNTFDLITCFGVLHHIPNVSALIGEIYRSLAPGGYALIREPIVSMGDWRQPRNGLTKHERGIPLVLFRQMIRGSGFFVVRESKCLFSLMSRMRALVSGPLYNSRPMVWLDGFLCNLPFWSTRYHAVRTLDKLRPTSVFYVLEKV